MTDSSIFSFDEFDGRLREGEAIILDRLREAISLGSGVSFRLLFGDSPSGLSGASGIDVRIAPLMPYAASVGRLNEKWLPFVAAVRSLVGFGRTDAVSIAMELRDRYPNLSLSQLNDSLRRCGLSQDETGYYLPELGMGNQSCKYNAHSPYLQCAVNPAGSCSGCESFEGAITSSPTKSNTQNAD